MKEVPIQIAPAEVKRLVSEDEVNQWKFSRERKGIRIFTDGTLELGVTKRGILVLIDTPKVKGPGRDSSNEKAGT